MREKIKSNREILRKEGETENDNSEIQEEIGQNLEKEKENAFWDGPLTGKEREKFSFFVRAIEGENDEKKRNEAMEIFIPYILGFRLENKLMDEGKELLTNHQNEKKVMRNGGYEWTRGDEEKLKIWKNYKETEKKWPSEKITLDKQDLQKVKEKLFEEALK